MTDDAAEERLAASLIWRVLQIVPAPGWWALNLDTGEACRVSCLALCERTDESGVREIIPLDSLMDADCAPYTGGTDWYAYLGENPTEDEIEAERQRGLTIVEPVVEEERRERLARRYEDSEYPEAVLESWLVSLSEERREEVYAEVAKRLNADLN